MSPARDQHILHQRRRAGILLHPTSLPGPYPAGLVCHDAYRFVEFLSHAGISVWQMLPLGPTHSDRSPYQALSAHACETSLLSLDWLRDRKLLRELPDKHDAASHHHSLEQAWANHSQHKSAELSEQFADFCERHAHWLDDYALFMTIREQRHGQLWSQWPAALRDRDSTALQEVRSKARDRIGFYQFGQFLFFQQWMELRRYAGEHGVLLFGDLPIYVAYDSVDVWARPELFMLDKQGQPKFVAGVPPDYFSVTGQRWGNPQYDWKAMQAEKFQWWQQRMQTQLQLFDLVRVDHFRGFEAYWEIKAEEETAINGRWVKAPGKKLLKSLRESFHALPLVAEDLGVITEEVTALREAFDLPGMKILQFAFDGNPKNVYLPHYHEFNSVVYTGTHDNDTSLSWYELLDEHTRRNVQDYVVFGEDEAMPWPLIRTALASVACLAVLPMQDILGLGQGERMNTPGTRDGNWHWRFDWSQVPDELAPRLQSLCQRYDR
ncbi:MAG: 4-alpha-glucanotransferase [Gammaproteobacteria bacterium]